MNSVRAIGQFNGKQIELVAVLENGETKLYQDGEYSDFHTKVFNAIYPFDVVIAGTYSPEPNTLTYIYTALNEIYFDRVDEIEVTGELEELPYEEGVIY